eukprot:CAMPEP_0168608818 /NCGR_PEP_ID=MMETSP0449_2-20121227/858_1 /TAXON_ID=1082188 /ORGANISM="Strombidium rassoulzadegani, Strain ras09" /LENGTH=176 /DNA_ID=CAMNT_0008648885 /DNA_START=300 /DNA_END=830 /DNA_ORIENTATION=+
MLTEGVIYVYGRDKCYRPMYITNVEKFQAMKKQPSDHEVCVALILMFEYMKRNMNVPGKIENTLFVLDTYNISYFKTSSLLKSLLNVLQQQYKCTTRSILIVNSPKAVTMLYNAVYYLMDEYTAKKIQITSEPCNENMDLMISKNQREEKLGGHLPNKDSDFWPPSCPSENFEPVN